MFPARSGCKADGIGALWMCGSKLCSCCVSKPARKNRKLAEYVLDNLKYSRRRFIVLTMPDKSLSGHSLDEQVQIINYAYRQMYRHSDYFKNTVDGAIKTLEFTVDKRRTNPYHVHINLIADASLISYTTLKEEWNKAIQIAFNQFGIASSESQAIIYIKQIVKRAIQKTDERKEINEQNALEKISRYITKPQNWAKLPISELAGIIGDRKFFRLFEVSGSCREIARAVRRSSPKQRPVKATPDVSSFSTMAVVAPTSSVQLKNPFVPAVSPHFPNPPPKRRKKSWYRRISDGDISLKDYKYELETDFVKARKFRTEQLRKKYFWVNFRTLDGIAF